MGRVLRADDRLWLTAAFAAQPRGYRKSVLFGGDRGTTAEGWQVLHGKCIQVESELVLSMGYDYRGIRETGVDCGETTSDASLIAFAGGYCVALVGNKWVKDW